MSEEIPNPPEISVALFEDEPQRKVTLGVYRDMSEIHAETERAVAKYTYTVPARQQTYRTYGPLILVAALLYFLVPPFLATHPDQKTLATVIIAIVAIAAGAPLIDSIIKAVRGR
jgi:hypothetical protein